MLDLEEGFEQSGEELELRYEEDNQDLSEPSEIEGEDPEYAQLRKEERESALADAGIDPYESEEEKKEREQQSDIWFWTVSPMFTSVHFYIRINYNYPSDTFSWITPIHYNTGSER